MRANLYEMNRDQTIAHLFQLEQQWVAQPAQRETIERQLRQAREWLKDMEFRS